MNCYKYIGLRNCIWFSVVLTCCILNANEHLHEFLQIYVSTGTVRTIGAFLKKFQVVRIPTVLMFMQYDAWALNKYFQHAAQYIWNNPLFTPRQLGMDRLCTKILWYAETRYQLIVHFKPQCDRCFLHDEWNVDSFDAYMLLELCKRL